MKSISLALVALLVPALSFATPKNNLEDLSKKDKLEIITQNIHTIWNDGNITTGTSVVYAALVKTALPETKQDWTTLGEELFAEVFKVYENKALPKDTDLKVKTSAADEADVETVVAALAEANDYAEENEDGRNAFRRQTWQLVRTLGDLEQIQFVTVSTKLLNERTEDTGEKRNVRLHAFINKETKKAVLIYTIEGRI